jgi:hypothetical protein
VSRLRRASAVASNSCRPECRAKDASRANYVVAAVRKSTAEIRNNKSVSGKSDGAEMIIDFFKRQHCEQGVTPDGRAPPKTMLGLEALTGGQQENLEHFPRTGELLSPRLLCP